MVRVCISKRNVVQRDVVRGSIVNKNAGTTRATDNAVDHFEIFPADNHKPNLARCRCCARVKRAMFAAGCRRVRACRKVKAVVGIVGRRRSVHVIALVVLQPEPPAIVVDGYSIDCGVSLAGHVCV